MFGEPADSFLIFAGLGLVIGALGVGLALGIGKAMIWASTRWPN